MPEEVARKVAAEVLHDAGLRKGWHKILVRFGKNTTKNFEDPSEPGVVRGTATSSSSISDPFEIRVRATPARPSRSETTPR